MKNQLNPQVLKKKLYNFLCLETETKNPEKSTTQDKVHYFGLWLKKQTKTKQNLMGTSIQSDIQQKTYKTIQYFWTNDFVNMNCSQKCIQ